MTLFVFGATVNMLLEALAKASERDANDVEFCWLNS